MAIFLCNRWIILFNLLLLMISPAVFSATEHFVWMKSSTQGTKYSMKPLAKSLIRSEAKGQEQAYQLVEIKDRSENDRHIRYDLYFKNTKVWDHEIILHRQFKGQNRFTGVFVDGIEQDISDQDPLLSKKEATASILSAYSAVKYKKISKIIYLDQAHRARFGYVLSFYSVDPNGQPLNPHFLISAHDGSIFKRWDELASYLEGEGPGGSVISLPYRDGYFQYGHSLPHLPSLGRFPMEFWLFWCYMKTSDYEVINLKNAEISAGASSLIFPIMDEEERCYTHFSGVNSVCLIPVYDVCWPWTYSYVNSNDEGYAPVNGSASPINDAMYFLKEIFELYYSVGVRDPIGNKDLPLRVYTHVSGLDNAFAIPTIYDQKKRILAHQQIVLSSGGSYFSALTQSVVAHELSHNFTKLNSGLVYSGQSGAINEAFSDMAAIAMMDKVRQQYSFYWDGMDWSIGRESSKSGTPVRYLDYPSLDGYSIEHARNYHSKLDVHDASGVFNRAFYLLANQPGWSIHDAFHTMVKANQDYWSANSNFNQAACGVIQSAKDLHFNAQAVVDSFHDVGVDCKI